MTASFAPFAIIGGIAIFAFLFLTLGTRSMWRERKRSEWWRLARELGGLFTDPGLFELSARLPGKNLDLVIRERRDQGDERGQLYTDVVVMGPPISRRLSVVPEEGIGGVFNTPDIRTGDEEFDKRLIVRNKASQREEAEDRILAAAILGSEARKLFVSYDNRHEPSLKLDAGAIFFTFLGDPELSAIRKAVKELSELSGHIAVTEEEIPKRILKNLLAEPLPEVVYWFLETLVEHFPESDEAQEALEFARKYPDPSVKGYATLSDPEPSRSSIIAVAREFRARPEIRSRAITALDRFPLVPDLLTEIFNYLSDDNSALLRLAALEVLGNIGTRECVEKLLPYTEGLLADGDVKKAAREAVERIQSRLGNAEAGRISVVDSSDETGRISIAAPGPLDGAIRLADEAGRISEA